MQAKPNMNAHTYTVTATPKYPAWNDHGQKFEIVAANAKEAISKARKQLWREALYDRHDGPVTYRAERAEA